MGSVNLAINAAGIAVGKAAGIVAARASDEIQQTEMHRRFSDRLERQVHVLLRFHPRSPRGKVQEEHHELVIGPTIARLRFSPPGVSTGSSARHRIHRVGTYYRRRSRISKAPCLSDNPRLGRLQQRPAGRVDMEELKKALWPLFNAGWERDQATSTTAASLGRISAQHVVAAGIVAAWALHQELTWRGEV